MSTRRFLRLALVMIVLSGIACKTLTPAASTTGPSSEPDSVVTNEATSSTTGTLVIKIVYTGQWYRDTFGYAPDAPNIRHVALVMPVNSQIGLKGPGWVFTSLKFTPFPEPLAIQEKAPEYAIFLKYLYDAPGGVAFIELAPGEYNVAVAFIAAPLPPPDDNAFLYPGVTGGGASNEFQIVEVLAGKIINLSVELTDDNGWG